MKCVIAVLKLILCILILFSGTLIGLHLSQRLTRRRDILLGFDGMLHRAAIQIEYNAGDLCEVFSDNFADFTFQHNRPFDEQWAELLDSFSYILTKEDMRMLSEFTKGLGTADSEAQRSHIALYIQFLGEHIASAQEEIQVKSKMYRIIPLSLGMVLSLLLI